MKKRIILALFVLVCVFSCFSVAACSNNNEQVHAAKTEWTMDETNHWHECAVTGHDDQLDAGAHKFGNVTTIQTGDTADSAKQVKFCEICGYEVYSKLTAAVRMDVTPAVTIGDESAVKTALVEEMKKFEAGVKCPAFAYAEYVTNGNTDKYLTEENVAFEKLTLDFGDADLSEPGYKKLTVSYNGTKSCFDVLLTPDLSKVEKTVYHFPDQEEDEGITIYANYYLSPYYNEGSMALIFKWEHVDLDNCIIVAHPTETRSDLLIIDDDAGTIDMFNSEMLGGEPVVYTIDSLGYTLNVHTANGHSYCDIYTETDGTTVYVNTVEVRYVNDKTISVSEVGIFAIGNDNKLTAVNESNPYTGEFVKDGKTYKVDYNEEDKMYYVYLVTVDGEGERVETLVNIIVYVTEKDGMAIYVISFEEKTVKRYASQE